MHGSADPIPNLDGRRDGRGFGEASPRIPLDSPPSRLAMAVKAGSLRPFQDREVTLLNQPRRDWLRQNGKKDSTQGTRHASTLCLVHYRRPYADRAGDSISRSCFDA